MTRSLPSHPPSTEQTLPEQNQSPPSTVYLIDASGYIFRAYHALPPLSRGDGTPVGAVFGFVSMIFKLWQRLENHPLLTVFDASRVTFRHAIYPAYKQNRPETPEDLIPQFSLIRQACTAMGLPFVEDPNYEADDLIATYAQAYKQRGYDVVILSSDKDLMQLVDDKVSLLDPMKNKPIATPEVREKFGVPPHKVIDVQALCGDGVDNVPGVPGIGIKTAALLINEFGSLENLYANLDDIKQPKRRTSLEDNKEAAFVSKRLVTLATDVPLPLPIDNIEPVRTIYTPTTVAFLKAQHFTSLVKRLGEAHTVAMVKATTSPGHASPGDSPGTKGGASPLTPRDGYGPTGFLFSHDIITSPDHLEAWVAASEHAGLLAIDTETTGLTARQDDLVGISLALPLGIAPDTLTHGDYKGTSMDGYRAAYIPLRHKTTMLSDPNLHQLPLSVVQKILGPILQDTAILKIAHNVKFDSHILGRHGLPMTTYTDTMLLSYLVDGAQHGHGLDELAQRYFDYTMQSYKEVTKLGSKQRRFDEVAIPEAAFYASEDAAVTMALYTALLPRLVESQAVEVYEGIERPLIAVLTDMESNGIALDTRHLRRVYDQLEEEAQRWQKSIHDLSGQNFNLASTQQLSRVLFEDLHLPPQGKRGKNGCYSTNVDVLQSLRSQGHLIADWLLQWRQVVKLQSTYTTSLIDQVNPTTKRLHTTYGMVTTTTGRLSSSNPNLQNIPIRTPEGRLIRQAFVAPPGHLLVSFDYSQIELRLLAHMANIEPLIAAFRSGADIHARTAAEVFSIKEETVTPDLRRQAKAINFGIIYGMSAFGLSQQLGIPVKEAQAYIDAYFKAYPGIQNYMHRTISEAQHRGYVETLFGRRCYTPDINSNHPPKRQMAERQAINAPIQGSAADIIKIAMNKIHANLKDPSCHLDAKMLLQVHDELIFEVAQDDVPPLVRLVTPLMETVIPLKVPLVVAFGQGPNWDACH